MTLSIQPFNKLMQFPVLILSLLTALVSLNAYSAQPTTPVLIDSQWLQNKLRASTDNLVLLDLRTQEAYLKSHIPGAINIPFGAFNRSINQVKGFLLTPLKFQELMEKNGIKQDDYLVLYSDKTVLDSTRIYWSFDFYGHKKLTVLNGGLHAWQKHGGKTETEANTLPESNYQVAIHPEKFASKFKTLMATKQSEIYIVDARPYDEYSGKKSKTDVFGHIPTAVNLPWKNLVEAEEGSTAENTNYQYLPLHKLQDQLDQIPKDKKIIVYCNGGRESSVLYFGLKLLGREAALYDGSWFEWSADKSLPIEINK